MAERKQADQQDQQPDDEGVRATSAQYAGADPSTQVPSEMGEAGARNPKDLGTNVDDLPPVPGAGEFMPTEEATEETAPTPEQQSGEEANRSTKKG